MARLRLLKKIIATKQSARIIATTTKAYMTVRVWVTRLGLGWWLG